MNKWLWRDLIRFYLKKKQNCGESVGVDENKVRETDEYFKGNI